MIIQLTFKSSIYISAGIERDYLEIQVKEQKSFISSQSFLTMEKDYTAQKAIPQ